MYVTITNDDGVVRAIHTIGTDGHRAPGPGLADISTHHRVGDSLDVEVAICEVADDIRAMLRGSLALDDHARPLATRAGG